VTVEDNVNPVAICQNVTVQLDATGNASTTSTGQQRQQSDACGIASLSLSQHHIRVRSRATRKP
jgi:hypothetical protein